jgi:hypothetical protein
MGRCRDHTCLSELEDLELEDLLDRKSHTGILGAKQWS